MPEQVIGPELDSGNLELLKTDAVLPPIAFTASYVSGSPASRLMEDLTKEAVAFLNGNPLNAQVAQSGM